MTCLICGDEQTVRSHIVPKAITRDLRRGYDHAILGSSNHDGIKKTQGGVFSNEILCREHEAITSKYDTYAISFLRRAKEGFDYRSSDTFWVENYDPQVLSRFVASVIWKEVHALGEVNLGPYESKVRAHIFDNAELTWPMMVWRDYFTLDTSKALEFNTHPYRARFAERNAWMFTVLGFSFVAISDNRGLSKLPKDVLANSSNPLKVIVGHEMDYRDVRTLQPIIAKMRTKYPKPSRT